MVVARIIEDDISDIIFSNNVNKRSLNDYGKQQRTNI